LSGSGRVRAPERNDVVVGFVSGRDFDQINRPLAPVALWLDPGAWTLVVVVVEVFVMAEVTAALQQTKPSGFSTEKLLTDKCFGLFSGRQIHSPLPAWIARPDESCSSRR
jgi:hypothetical protein